MKLSTISTIYRKEILDMRRDRRTVVTTVILPIVVFPILVQLVLMTQWENRGKEETVSVAMRGPAASSDLADALKKADFQIVVKDDLRAAVQKKLTAAALEIVGSEGRAEEIRVYFDFTRRESRRAQRRIVAVLDNLKDEIIRKEFARLGVKGPALATLSVKPVNTADRKREAGFLWGGMVAYALILFIVTSGMHPAVDMTAGEKERKTMEALLASPAGRYEIVLGKILATTTATIVTGLLNVAGLFLSLRLAHLTHQQRGLMTTPLGGIPLDAAKLGLLALIFFPLAVMTASLMVGIAVRAKTFKEGAGYLHYLAFATLFPAIGGMLPGHETNAKLAVIPFFNAIHLIKGVLAGDLSRLAFSIALGSNVLYATVAFYLAVRAFRNESVLLRV